MTEAELKRVQSILDAQQGELTGALGHREKIVIERSQTPWMKFK